MSVTGDGAGAVGYLKKRSVPSLVGGTVIGASFLGSAYLINSGSASNGFLLGSASSTALIGVMLPRFISTQKFMPAGVNVVIGAAALAYNGYQAKQFL